MKISKKLLHSIAAGLVLAGSVSSCGIHDDNLVDPQVVICEGDEHSQNEPTKDPFDCPPCGMG